MKGSLFNWLIAFTLIIVHNGCFVLGIHTKVHNPTKVGKYPKFTEKDILLGELNTYKSCYDVSYYELAVDLNPENRSLKGHSIIHARTVDSFDTLQLDLYENLTIDKITNSANESLSYYRKEGAVLVVMNRQMRTDEHFQIKVNYHGKPEVAKKPPWRGGFVWKKDKNKDPWIGVACESEGASIWWPCKDHSSDEADSALLTYTVPKGLIAVGNGRLIHQSTSKSDTAMETFTWKVHHPINTYNVTIYAGKFELIQDSMAGEKGTIWMNHYVLPKHKTKARKHFQQLKPIIRFFEKAYGSYAWYEDGFKLVESPYAGMEHQSAIAYGNGYKNFFGFNFDHIILHETAHEWWGNSITALDFSDMWLQEGFATYAEAMYVENSMSRSDYISYMFFERLFIKNKRPVVGPVNRRYFDYRDSDVYMKGSWILHTLRNTIDDDSLFFDILKSFYQQYQYQLVTSQHFIDMVNQKTAKDYTHFFDQYLNYHQSPELKYYLDYKTSPAMIYFKWENTIDQFRMPCKIRYVDQSGQKREMTINPTTKVQKMELPDYSVSGTFIFDDRQKLYALKEVKKIKKEVP